MTRKSDGSGTIYRRGNIWWVKIHIDGNPVYESSHSTKKTDAVKLRNKLLARKERGEISGGSPDKVLIGELLDDLIRSDVKESTMYIYQKVIEKNIRPSFGAIRTQRLTTDMMEKYRQKRKTEGAKDSTVNRELSVLRSALYKGKRRTPPKVNQIPYFPLVAENNIRRGFLTDEQYERLRDELPDELKALFVTAYITGMRRSELISIRWPQVDFEAGFIVLQTGETKNGDGRGAPIVKGDMLDLLNAAKKEHDARWPNSPWVFSRLGQQILDFRATWQDACKRAGVPDLHLHDLRRTAVRNMRRAGIPQVVRMKISGHRTDSMERRYNIIDAEDLSVAKELLERRLNSSSRDARNTAKMARKPAKPEDIGPK
jgi:integrase